MRLTVKSQRHAEAIAKTLFTNRNENVDLAYITQDQANPGKYYMSGYMRRKLTEQAAMQALIR